MTLDRIGQRPGTFEVLGSLGAGGMGEVYRARDTRLGREVAIEFLPAAFRSRWPSTRWRGLRTLFRGTWR